ncbi:hypothetical protein ABTL51_19160, partial [Acinetobacter baumannii]
MRAGTPDPQRVTLNGMNPYWRVAYTIGDEHQSLTVGHFGTIADVVRPEAATPADQFRDLGFDAQFQYIGPDDRHIISAQ